jgi:hypothetical protein
LQIKTKGINNVLQDLISSIEYRAKGSPQVGGALTNNDDIERKKQSTALKKIEKKMKHLMV